MKHLNMLFGALFFLAAAIPINAAESSSALVLCDFSKDFKTNTVTLTDSKSSLTPGNTLRVVTGHATRWPGITLKAPNNKWDLSSYLYITMEVHNLDAKPVTVYCRVDNPGADGSSNCITGSLTISPNATGSLQVNLTPTPWRLSKPVQLIGMRAAPGQAEKIDPGQVNQLIVYVTNPTTDKTFEIGSIRAGGRAVTLDTSAFFPFIDEFGQFIHSDWPGKIHAVTDFSERHKVEITELAANPGPPNRNQYGGWTSGPKLNATGFFRVDKYQGKWWLVDPEGRLFWSHGIDCVGAGDITPITDRENYFRNLPATGSPSARFYGTGNWAPHGYYQDHVPYRTYDFSQANLLRKYGENWERDSAQAIHQRLKSWGMNTIANWSNAKVYQMRQTPYTATISFNAKTLQGSEGYWGKFYDVFDPSFRQNLRRRLESDATTLASDPWCMGLYVHNELGWGSDTSLALATLASPVDQPAKKVFVDELKFKYEGINKLNEAWKTSHASWDALLASTQKPNENNARADLTRFYSKFAETYFQVIREELKKAVPHHLYLGCRFAWVNDRAVQAAAKYCDVVSFNRYEYSVETQGLPDGLDLPIIIGEFHFGALDRGMFHTGLKPTTSQDDRAAKYKAYVQGALRNPAIVGTHWFQYQDQATTGRGDGENYQIGFVDICDTPYSETVRSSREVGYGMYEYRLKLR